MPANALKTAAPEHEFITVKEAAALLRVTQQVLYEAIKAGDAPWAHRLGPRTIRIHKGALMRAFGVAHG